MLRARARISRRTFLSSTDLSSTRVRDNGAVTESQPSEPTDPREQVRVRRAPKIPAFMVVGGLLGFLGTVIATSLFPADENVGFTTLVAYFSLYGITIGVLLGAVVGVVLDRRSQKRARLVDAERE